MLPKSSALGLLLLLLGSLASSFKFDPEVHEDGAYFLTTSDAGEEIYQKLDINLTLSTAAPPPPWANSSSLPSRQKRNYLPSGSYVTCNSDGAVIDFYSFYNIVYNQFWSACSWASRAGEHQAIAVMNQGIVAYMCSYTSNPCNVGEWWQSVDNISNQCNQVNQNWKQCGWEYLRGWGKSYGFTDTMHQFCFKGCNAGSLGNCGMVGN